MVYFILWKNLRLVPKFNIFSKALVAGLAMGAFIYLLKDANLIVLIIFGSLVYFGVLYIVGGINKSMIAKIIK